MKIGFIGAGNMASAIIRGVAARYSGEEARCVLYDIDPSKPQGLQQELGREKIEIASSLEAVFPGCDGVVLAVKPYHIKELLPEIAQNVQPGQLLLSIIAGVSIHYFEEQIPNTAFIRVMPNTGAAVGKGVAGLVAGTLATSAQKEMAQAVFEAVGTTVWIEDQDVDGLSAISGSGGAYFYLLAQYMAEAAAQVGLTLEQGAVLARQTLIGVGKTLEAFPEKTPEQLRLEITSPKGSTLAAIETFQNHDFAALVTAAVKAAAARGREIGVETTGKQY